MKRSRRIAPVQRLFDATEQDRARTFGATQQQMLAEQQKLAELRQYREDYAAGFRQRASAGCGAAALLDFQAFLARLDLALRQQEQAVARAREQSAQARGDWQVAARRSRALDTVVGCWREDENYQAARSEQQHADERAQRSGRNNLQESE